MAEAFEWVLTVRPELVREARAELTALSAELLCVLPDAATVVVLAQGQSVQVLSVSGDALDLSDVPFELAERVCTMFGPGAYRLAREGQSPCRVIGRGSS